MLEVLAANPDLHFQNYVPNIHFWANLGQKSQNFLLRLKIGIHGISEERIPNPELDFYIYIHSFLSVPVLSKFSFTSFCSNLTIFGFLGLVSI